jgi:hypothetical protein
MTKEQIYNAIFYQLMEGGKTFAEADEYAEGISGALIQMIADGVVEDKGNGIFAIKQLDRKVNFQLVS